MKLKIDWEKQFRKAFIFDRKEQVICWRRKTKKTGTWIGRNANFDDVVCYIKEFLLPKNGN